jgi:hypothetical protein
MSTVNVLSMFVIFVELIEYTEIAVFFVNSSSTLMMFIN